MSKIFYKINFSSVLLRNTIFQRYQI